MTEQMHPMIPPNILLNNWESDWFAEREHADVLLIQAYQAGADAELEACCEWLKSEPDPGHVDLLRSCATDLARWRRPAIQPEPEELTDEEILKIHDQFDIDGTEDVTKGMPLDVFWDSYQPQQRIAFARAIIAADRAQWGRPATTETP